MVIMYLFIYTSSAFQGFLGGTVVKNPAKARDACSIPGSGRSPEEGNGNPLTARKQMGWHWDHSPGLTEEPTDIPGPLPWPQLRLWGRGFLLSTLSVCHPGAHNPSLPHRAPRPVPDTGLETNNHAMIVLLLGELLLRRGPGCSKSL